MIILAQFMLYSTRFLFSKLKTQFNKQSSMFSIANSWKENSDFELNPTSKFDLEKGLKFFPPVYEQRYSSVQKILRNACWQGNIKKVVEFGCAEMKFFYHLKQIHGVIEIVEIDVDKSVLQENAFRIQPFLGEFLKRRIEPLKATVTVGSISLPDQILLNSDAVVCIEIIEHLYPDVFEAVPYNIFGFIKPKVAIFTTPNADFNALFPNFTKFRHYDHKFEWTREEFEDWAINITNRFPEYTVSFKGIGPGPPGTENLGCCSQMAVFTKTICILQENNLDINCDDFKSFGICVYESCTMAELNKNEVMQDNNNDNPLKCYKEITSVEFPYSSENRTKEEIILDEALYRISSLSGVYGRFFNVEKDQAEIPLTEIIHYLREICTYDELESVLLAKGFQLENCLTQENLIELCVIYDPEKDNSSDSESSYCESTDYNVNVKEDEGHELNWDSCVN